MRRDIKIFGFYNDTLFAFYLLLFALYLFSCSSNYSPKPSGYFYIDMEDHDYCLFSDYSSFEFAVSTQVNVKEFSASTTKDFQDKFEVKNANTELFNLDYPSLNAQIYCSFLPIMFDNFAEITEESRKFAYLHVIKADAIHEQIFENPEQKVYGLIYEIRGNVASPVQFVLTDSVSSFFRGALYFDNTPNQDSIAPVLKYVNEDIRVLINSFRWKK
jgi:gliding motility-associated lipoprotein GldD